MALFEGFIWNLLAVGTALLAVGFAYFKWSYQYWKRLNVPFLEPTIPFGNVVAMFKRTESVGDWTLRMYAEAKSKSYKYFGIYVLTLPILVVVDLELAKHVLTKDFSSFVDRGVYTNEKDDPLSDHLFATTGKKWRNLRVKLTPTFTSGKMKAMFQTLVDCGLILEKYIGDQAGNKDAVEIKSILERFTTDIIGSCAFGLDCNSFKEPNSSFMRLGKRVFDQTHLEMIKSIFTMSFPNLSRTLHLTAIAKDVSDFYRKIVEDTVAYREKNNYRRKDFLQLLIDIKNKEGAETSGHKGDGNTLTLDEISAQSFIFFLAGFETSSTTMTFVLYLLAAHQDIQEKVREEINAVLEKHNDEITYDSLSEMKYMGQVIDETLRMYPPVPVLMRIADQDYKIPGEDVIIEKGTTVFIPIIGYQHDEEYFSDPQVFDPERFNEENKKNIRQYSNMPFGEGPRICIGERFGIMQTKVGLTSILRRYRVTLNEKTKVPITFAPESNMILGVEGGVWLNFHKV